MLRIARCVLFLAKAGHSVYTVVTNETTCGGRMESIGVRELKKQGSEILRRVREEGASFEVTYRGRAIARLVAVTKPDPASDSHAAYWERWDRLSEAIGDRWPDGVSALEAVRADRREL